ncbi:hypothetical protein [Prochlorococcus sp. MIT 1306]|uniref:hypothetical protein n=1 Tax=Prochlorococcus sp. MIT 1306 TaxID=1799667 RepID=UPI0039B67F51
MRQVLPGLHQARQQLKKKENVDGFFNREFQSGKTQAPRLQHGKEMDIQLVQETVCLMKEAIDDHLDDQASD